MEKEEASKKSLTEVFERVWSQALLAVSSVEEEASKVASRVAEVAGWSQDEVKRRVGEFTEKLAAQRREVERTVEESVKRALQRLRVPRREELAAINARLDQLSQRIDALMK